MSGVEIGFLILALAAASAFAATLAYSTWKTHH